MEILNQYGWWTVLSKEVDRTTGPNGAVLCRCRCGQKKMVPLHHLRSGASKSCGCRKPEATRAARTTHGGAGTRLYKCWANMIHRCEDPKVRSYKYYGAEGIRVCKAWHSFATFRTWALSHGYAPGLTIERVDNDGDYTPKNCTWVTQSHQRRNTSRAIFLTAWGESKHMAEWVEDPRCQVTYAVLKERIKLGWKPERAISTPLLTKGGKPR